MRLFVALDIEPEIRRRIVEFRDRMRPYAPDVRWVGPETFHITLQFLGETDKVASVQQVLKTVRAAPVPLNVRGTGFFPNAKSPRVFWVGVESDQNLQNLIQKIGDSLQPLGFEREEGRFQPHLTLARAGSGRPRPVRGEHRAAGLRVVASRLEGGATSDFGAMTAREFRLYQSTLSPSGAKYSTIEQYPLE